MIAYGITKRAPENSQKLSPGALFQLTAFGLNIFSPDAYGGNISRNSLKNFLRQHSNQQSCNHSRHHQRRSIIIQQSHRMRCRNRHQQLTDVMAVSYTHLVKVGNYTKKVVIQVKKPSLKLANLLQQSRKAKQ